MSDITVDKINNLAGTGAANFTYGIKVGGSAQTIGGGTFTNNDTEPTSPSDGDIWYAPTAGNLDYRAGSEWKRVIGGGTANPLPFNGDRMLVAGAQTAGFGGTYTTNLMRYIDITGTGGQAQYGYTIGYQAVYGLCGAQGNGRAVWAGGQRSSGLVDVIFYTATNGSNVVGTDFGDLANACNYLASASNGTTAIFNGGVGQTASLIEKVTIATTGNASTWSGTATSATQKAGASNGTKGFFMGGMTPSPGASVIDTIEVVTIDTEANATDWGDLVGAKRNGPGACGQTNGRILVGGGWGPSLLLDEIEYFDSQNAGNAYSFGNLAQNAAYTCASCNDTKAVWAGGYGGSRSNFQNIVTIATAANATDFGDYFTSIDSPGSCSGAPA
jgi:hypothetical protein